MARCCRLLLLTALCFVVVLAAAHAAPQKQKTFASPDEAVKALVDAVKQGDVKALKAIFGPDSGPLVASGDEVADRNARERFAAMYDKKHSIDTKDADNAVLIIGDDDWPFPIPLVRQEGAWLFDTAQGREEILARRIGRNELDVIQVCLAYVDAQREFASEDRDGDGRLAYATKFTSEPGKKDGLYWETLEGETPSPLGDLMAAAQAKGYTNEPNKDAGPTPYYGYLYRILQCQGPDAPGGAYDYVVKGTMVGGFAMVAYPAQYGVSGIMTFVVNHDGLVYQKDLGDETAKVAGEMKCYNPDSSWKAAAKEAPEAK